MKGFILFILAVLICFSSFTYAQLSGNKYIGTGGDYTTFAIACSTLNADGVGAGGVTFIIYTGTYTESAPLSIDIATNKPTSENPVTFKPDVGATVVLNVGGQLTGSRWAIRIGTSANTVDYVTLDGSNSLGGTTRDWTIKSTAATYGIEPIDIYGDYCTVKNCIIDMNNGGYSGSGFGITLREATPTSNFCTIQNNYIKGNNGISVGRNTTVEQEGHLIKGNEIHSLNRGIYVYRSKNIIIEENEIIGDAYSGYPAGACYGIYTASASGNTGELVIRNNIIRNLGSNSGTIAAQTIRCINPSGPGTYKIYGNKIYNIYNATSSTGNPIVYGIQLVSGGSTSTYDIYNNFVTGLYNNDPDASTTVYTYGITYNTSGNANIYFNTVYVHETTRDHLCAAIHLTSGNAANSINIKNNIFKNSNSSGTYKSYVIYKSATLTSVLNSSDYNNFYVDGAVNSFVGYDGSADRQTLTNWIDNTIYDDNSKSVNIAFAGETDLHLSGGSVGDVNLIGTTGLGVANDIDGDVRSLTYPYMGADEGATPLPVELASLSYKLQNGFINLSWTTATEVNSYKFEVERSADKSGWAKIGEVSASGNSNSNKEYSFTDNQPASGKYFYRLKMVDNDGSFAYSKEIEVENLQPSTFDLRQNYPNPFNPTTTITYQLPVDANVKLMLFTITGELVRELVNSNQSAGNYNVTLDASGLASGTYIYRLVAGDFMSTKKLVILK